MLVIYFNKIIPIVDLNSLPLNCFIMLFALFLLVSSFSLFTLKVILFYLPLYCCFYFVGSRLVLYHMLITAACSFLLYQLLYCCCFWISIELCQSFAHLLFVSFMIWMITSFFLLSNLKRKQQQNISKRICNRYKKRVPITHSHIY